MTTGFLRGLARALRWLPAAALALGGMAQAQAQDWPAKQPVRLIFPFATGGTVDLFTRLLGNALSQSTGQAFVVESRTGAGGSIGAQAVARAPADGYTLLMTTNSTHSIAPALSSTLPYNTVEDFTPIALLIETNVLILGSPSMKVKNMAELLALARSKPGAINFASGGAGTNGHLTFEVLKALARIEMTHVPYKGIGAAYPDLMAGNVHLLTDAVAGGIQHVKAGRVVALAVSGPRRSPVAPDVPTVAETVPGFSVVSWFGLYGPRGMPPALVRRINEEVNKVLHLPEMKARLEGMDLIAARGSPADFATYVAGDRERWSKLVRERNIKVE